MTSFKLYLPSNACPKVYPNNTATNYRTVFDKPIDLEGQWEVGLESICYSPRIHDDTERAQITLKVGKASRKLITNTNPCHYRLPEDNRWPGFDGVIPSTFETDPNKLDNVLETLNSLNDVMLISGSAFNFRHHFVRGVIFEPFDENLYVRLTPRMARLLGFRYIDTVGRHEFSSPFVRNVDIDVLTQEDYRVRYLHTYLQKEDAITLKWNGTPFDGKASTFFTLWRSAMPYRIDVEIRENTLAVTNHDSSFALLFSPSLQRVVQRVPPIIGKDLNWGSAPLAFERGYINDHWYVNVYSTEMLTQRVYTHRDIPLSLSPWKSNTIRELLHVINHKVEKKLKRTLRRNYHKGRHHFFLKLQSSQHAMMTLGKRLEVEFSANLAYLLGFEHKGYNRHHNMGMREVDALFNRARQLHVLTNIIQPTAVGNKQLQILRDFVHQSTDDNMSVKHFESISYIPLRVSRIDSIHMQLVNANLESVNIKDATTLATLYFRKI